MKFISCASYYGSGSSAITDLVSEYSDVYSFTDEEFRFLHDPNGIGDLEYNLVENFNRHNSGRAIKKYKELVDFYRGNFFNKKYEKYFHGNWKKCSYQYLDELIDFSYHGWWLYDLLDRGKLFYFYKRIPNKLLKATIWRNKPERTLNNMKKEVTYCSHPSERKFLEATTKYINNLFSSIVKTNKRVMVDQIVPSTNIKRYSRYFDDIQVIIVDRDPRDIYILEKYVWKDGVIPKDPVTFCKWFNYTRNNRNLELKENNNVYYIQFEDLIYNYDFTVKKIENWLHLLPKHHVNQYRFFKPDISKKNTQTWKKYPNENENIKYIENKLSIYLYNYK